MTRLSLLLERVRAWWSGRWAVAMRNLAGLLLGRLFAAVAGLARSMWGTLGGRARLAVILAGLILVSSQTEALAPSLSETATRARPRRQGVIASPGAPYSDAFVDWIVEQHESNPDFFEEARDIYYDQQRM